MVREEPTKLLIFSMYSNRSKTSKFGSDGRIPKGLFCQKSGDKTNEYWTRWKAMEGLFSEERLYLIGCVL